jgi:AcrR family transcriptional regulator
LTPAVILDAAEAAAEQDPGGLSMRAVATRLGAAPMAIYNHFATKEELVDALLDRVLSRFRPGRPSDDWVTDLGAFARAHRRLLDEHPWAVAKLVTRPNPGPGAIRIGEHAFAILERGGYPAGPAMAAFSGIIALNYGWASFTAARTLAAGGAGGAEQLGAYGGEGDYQLVLGALLAGLSGSTGG